MGQTVNLLAYAFGGSNPSLPTKKECRLELQDLRRCPIDGRRGPRDTTDYHALFPDAVILERTMPSEVLNFCLPFKFARAVTVQSFVLRAFTAADEKILLTLDEAKALI